MFSLIAKLFVMGACIAPIVAVLVGLALYNLSINYLKSINKDNKPTMSTNNSNTTLQLNTVQTTETGIISAIETLLAEHPIDVAIQLQRVYLAGGKKRDYMLQGYSYITRIARFADYIARNPHNLDDDTLQSIIVFMKRAYDEDSSALNKSGLIGSHFTTDEQIKACFTTFKLLAIPTQSPKTGSKSLASLVQAYNPQSAQVQAQVQAPQVQAPQVQAPQVQAPQVQAPQASKAYPKTIVLEGVEYTKKSYVKKNDTYKYVSTHKVANSAIRDGAKFSLEGVRYQVVECLYYGKHVNIRALDSVQPSTVQAPQVQAPQVQAPQVQAPQVQAPQASEPTIHDMLTLMQRVMQRLDSLEKNS